VMALISSLIRKKSFCGFDHKNCIYLLLVLATGPLALVNGLLKEHWGRPRPINILEFGGNMQFAPPWFISGQCESNCSFSSGEASGAFWLFAFTLLLPQKWKQSGMYLALLIGGFVSFVRMAQGAHFFSDVMYSGMFLILLSLLCYRIVFGKAALMSVLEINKQNS
jgi:lipid A 4'-phosphatase